jgi:alpha-L-fucosidase
MGAWMKANGEAIYATKASPLQPLSWGRCTLKPAGKNTILYFSVFSWPADGKLVIPGVKNEIVSAKMLVGGATLKTEKTNDGLLINVPEKGTDNIATVIKVELKGSMEGNTDKLSGKMKTGSID